MHAAVNYSGADLVASPAISARRASRFTIAGAAMITAGALVAGPATQSLPDEIQRRAIQAVELTGLSVTASPLTIYPQIVTNTVTNIAALTQAIAADPLPVLSQVARNQLGYATEIGTAIGGIPVNWETYMAGRGGTFLANLKVAIEQGNNAEIVNQLSSFVLYGALATITPIYNALLTYTPRGSTVPNPGIPQQIAQNFANAVGAIFSSTTLVNGIFQPVYGAALSVLATAGDIVGGLVQSVSAGDAVGAINTVVNTPGLFVNAVLNGWNNPKSAAPFPALLTFIPVAPPTDPANGVTVTGPSIGLLGRLLVSIPQAIAKAITPVTPTTASSTPAATAVAAAAEPAQTKAVTAGTAEVAATSTEGSTVTSAASSTDTTTTEAAETVAKTEVSVPAAAGKTAKKTATSSTKASGDTGSAGKATGGKKSTAGSARSPRGKASSSSSSSSSSDAK
ncbi:hypothetical protein [Mycolicibacterium rhodesiae]|uniref:PE-PGRS family protein n=1 Tax=Mycolicibacterium rhodesiae TaxID=36814 RepID=A0A1X0J1S1_MYCRH|nr:hypothetical protein [Mycolicibacterium rhodesiae]MCV7344874.1 hypothetical protein [Mycolicibacterium rhodesiae]ORB55678.1 hypothetical protein BST42_04470 [Mycolicibacterium rhodesiae]